MATDFEEHAEIFALLLQFRKKKAKKEYVGSSMNRPKNA